MQVTACAQRTTSRMDEVATLIYSRAHRPPVAAVPPRRQLPLEPLPAAFTHNTPTFDYIVVGAGSAGCALVDRILRGTSSSSVLLLEAGPDKRGRRDPGLSSGDGASRNRVRLDDYSQPQNSIGMARSHRRCGIGAVVIPQDSAVGLRILSGRKRSGRLPHGRSRTPERTSVSGMPGSENRSSIEGTSASVRVRRTRFASAHRDPRLGRVAIWRERDTPFAEPLQLRQRDLPEIRGQSRNTWSKRLRSALPSGTEASRVDLPHYEGEDDGREEQ